MAVSFVHRDAGHLAEHQLHAVIFRQRPRPCRVDAKARRFAAGGRRGLCASREGEREDDGQYFHRASAARMLNPSLKTCDRLEAGRR
jgi:hypothetical protein